MKNKLQSCEAGFAKNDLKKPFPFSSLWYRVFLHDVTAVILVSQNNETEAMLVSQNQSAGSQTPFLCKRFILFQ